MFKSINLYGNSLIEESFPQESCHHFELNNETGTGNITLLNVFDGIELILNDIHMEYCQKNQQQVTNVLEINYCQEGRCECTFSKKNYSYMSSGDLAMYMLDCGSHKSVFPTSHYQGITITINFSQISNETLHLLNIFDVDLEKIRENLHKTPFFMIRANEMLRHIFGEIYLIKENLQENYIRVKIIELLIFISSLNVNSICNVEDTYFSGVQVAKTKQAHDLMVHDLSKHYTIEELAETFQISPTALKTTFKGIYGVPVYTYLKTYRLQLGEKLLRENKLSVSEIASKVGYQNPNKFTSAFRKAYAMTPTDFQKNV